MSKSAVSDNRTSQVIAITSGKGGVGKTSLTINLGLALARLGRKVCLFDADSNLANINIMLRVMPEYSLEHVIKGDKSITEIIMRKSGISIVPGASGLTEFVDLQPEMQNRMIETIGILEKSYDHMLVDTSAGIHENVLSFIEAAHQCLVVITPEPTSLTDAFSLLRVLKKRDYNKAINIVVNSANAELSARKVFNRFSSAVAKYIGYKLRYLGYVLKDEYMSSAISLQNPIVLQKPESLASRSIIRLASHLQRLTENDQQDGSLSRALKRKMEDVIPDLADPELREETEETAKESNVDAIDHSINRKQVLKDHNRALREFIEDQDISKIELRGVLSDLIDVYVGRFNDYPFDTVKILNHALEMEKIPQDKLNQLLMTLQLFYQGRMTQAEKETSAEYLRQLINNYVDQHRAFPFDVINTLYKYLDLESVPQNQIRQLLATLHLVYQDKYLVSRDEDDHEEQLYSPEHEQEEYEKVVALLQDKHLHNLAQKLKQNVAINDQKNMEEKSAVEEEKPHNSLLDSIKFASLTE